MGLRLSWPGSVDAASSPVHYLLFHDNAGRPARPHWFDVERDLALVVTSANPGGEPLLIDSAETMRRLAGIADAYLIHDRNIVVRCDDFAGDRGARARHHRTALAFPCVRTGIHATERSASDCRCRQCSDWGVSEEHGVA